MEKLIRQHSLDTFTDTELKFLCEYEEVMRPLANALDALQSDSDSYLGCLLPRIAHLKNQFRARLRGVDGKHLTYTKAIVQAVVDGIARRFDPMFKDERYRLASCFHPNYKLLWVKIWDPSKLEEIREQMVARLTKHLRENDPNAQTSSLVTAERILRQSAPAREDEVDDLENLLSAYQQDGGSQPHLDHTGVARDLIKTWEGTPRTHKLEEDESFLGNKNLIELFRETNTGVVSSAACERFFSQGKDTLRAKRQGMSPKNFEALMFLRGNCHLWATPMVQKRREKAGLKKHPGLEKSLMSK